MTLPGDAELMYLDAVRDALIVYVADLERIARELFEHLDPEDPWGGGAELFSLATLVPGPHQSTDAVDDAVRALRALLGAKAP